MELLERKQCGLLAIPPGLVTPQTIGAAIQQHLDRGLGLWQDLPETSTKACTEVPCQGRPQSRPRGFPWQTTTPCSYQPQTPYLGVLQALHRLRRDTPPASTTLHQLAGLKGLEDLPPLNLSLVSSMRLPPEIGYALDICRYPEACIFQPAGQAGREPCLMLPPAPTEYMLRQRPLATSLGTWVETCRWVGLKIDDPENTQLSPYYRLAYRRCRSHPRAQYHA